MFKNMLVYILPKQWNKTADELDKALQSASFQSCMSADMQSSGWVSPRKNGQLVHKVGRQYLMEFSVEKKLLPTSVINQVTKAKAEEIEEQQGFKPGRKQMKEIKEQVVDELLPRAFPLQKSTKVWIDPVNGWLVLDTSSLPKGEEILKSLYKAIDKFPVESLHTEQSPLSCMTEWLATDETPAGFTIDQDTELRASGEGKATVRYVRHTLEADDVRRHIASGKQCTRLAMTWNDRLSLVLTESWILKRLEPLDVLKEGPAQNDDERFDSDFAMMAGEAHGMLTDLVAAMGGRVVETTQ